MRLWRGGTDVPQKPRRGASLPEAEAVLLVSRSEMDQAIARRLELGRDLLERRVSLNFYGMPVSSEVASLRNDFNTWDEYNEQLLTNQFSTGKVADDYRRVMYRSVSDRNTQQELKYVLEDIGRSGRAMTAAGAVSMIPPHAWYRMRTGSGTKGTRHYDWAMLQVAS